jgi:hypothetical protein
MCPLEGKKGKAFCWNINLLYSNCQQIKETADPYHMSMEKTAFSNLGKVQLGNLENNLSMHFIIKVIYFIQLTQKYAASNTGMEKM